MRGIYNLKNLMSKIDAPLIKKIFTTYFSITLVFSFLSLIIFVSYLENHFTQNEAISIMKNICLIWLIFLAFNFLSLHFLLKNSLSPLVNLISWSRNMTSLKEIEMPENTSEEIKQIYLIINESILRLKSLQEQSLQNEKSSAILKTTQMLAHDVRKPFTMLKIILDFLRNEENPQEIRNIIATYSPDVQKGMDSVNALIQDVMEIGSTSQSLKKESIKPQYLIHNSLNEVFKIHANAQINFHYSLNHNSCVYIDLQKIIRVFSNLLSNAVQAMQNIGDIFFTTNQIDVDGVQVLQFSIKNSNSYIDSIIMDKLFDAFFTHNKKNGTGLGLAIAKTMIEAHGGKITCHSEITPEFPMGFVEFSFTLPISQLQDRPEYSTLPINARSIYNQRQQSKYQNLNQENVIEELLIQSIQQNRDLIAILIIDDEKLYSAAIANMLLSHEKISPNIQIDIAYSADQAIEMVHKKNYHLMVVDVDLQSNVENGFSLVQRFRQQGKNSFICIHSNRICRSDHKFAIEVGADAFVSKPINRCHLFKLLLQSLEIP